MATIGGLYSGPLTLGGLPDYRAVFPTPRWSPTGSIRATPKSIGGSIEGGIAKALNKLGLSEKRAQQYATRTMAPLNDVTPVGNAIGMEAGGKQFLGGLSRGDARAMALGAGVFGLSALPGPTGKTAKRAAKGMFGNMMRDQSGAIRAWHGSPHDFDRFDMSKIGTGEGAQAYGHGLYFAENPATAINYRDNLQDAVEMNGVRRPMRDMSDAENFAYRTLVDSNLLGKGGGLPLYDDAIRETKEYITDVKAKEAARRAAGEERAANYIALQARDIEAALPYFEQWRDEGVRMKPTGRLYEVNINAEPEDFLDWDSPLTGQRGKSADFLRSELNRYLGSQYERQIDNFTPKQAGELLAETRGVRSTAPQLTQDALGAGIPGIRYLDQGSRQTGGTSNYVVFDDSLIDILNKF
jgi:hypothetical protein